MGLAGNGSAEEGDLGADAGGVRGVAAEPYGHAGCGGIVAIEAGVGLEVVGDQVEIAVEVEVTIGDAMMHAQFVGAPLGCNFL